MIERLQSREGQKQQLDQTNRGTSSSKKGDFWRRQCQLYDNQQQSKGKELALAEWKDPFNGIAIGEGGKPVERQIVLSKCYGKDNPGLAGGGLEEVGTVLESFLEVAANIADIASKVAPEPVTHYAMTALKEVLHMIQNKRDNAIFNEKLDKLSNKSYNTASRLLGDVSYMQKPDNRDNAINTSADLFVSAIDTIKDGFMRTASMFYAGMGNDLRGEPIVAMQYFEEAYKTGHEQLSKTKEALNNLIYKLRKNKKAKMEAQLQDFSQFMEFINDKKEHLKKRIENSHYTYTPSSTVTQENRYMIRNIQELSSNNQMLRHENQFLINQRNQEISKIENKLKEIIQHLEQQSFQQGDHRASTSGMSSLARGEASPSSTGREWTNHRDATADLGEEIQKYFASGRDNDRKGQFEEARDDFSRVIALDGNHMKAFMCRGMAHMELGKLRDAQADFTQVLNLRKDCFIALIQRGTTYQLMGRLKDALLELHSSARENAE